jgi:hypothetical protein
MLVQLDINGCDADDIQLELEQLVGEESAWVRALRPTDRHRGLLKGGLADAYLDLVTWVEKTAISERRLETMGVVCRLQDLGDVRDVNDCVP